MSSPVVVQGTAVSTYDHSSPPSGNDAVPPSSPTKGEPQPSRCRDPLFALLLYVNVLAIAAVAGIYGADAFSAAVDDSTSGYNYAGYMNATFVLGAAAIVLSGVTLPIMMCIPEALIKCSLLVMLILSGVMMALSFLWGNIVGGVFGLIFFLIFVCYARAVWSRIPFASVNLLTACTAIKKNCSLVFLAYFFVVLAFGWSLLWCVSLLGVWESVVQVSEDAVAGQQNTVNYGYLFLLLLSFFFTHQVIQNTMHVVVAGTVGSWWFSPEEGGCGAITGSLCRALTTSFGSICFGSLLVAILQSLKELARSARDQDNGILICLAECILGCLESLLEYFNKWAFIYVGLYGYSYLDAGKNVITLFKNRGWEAIIADDLISNVFFFLSLCVGGVCAAVGLAFDQETPEGWFVDSPNPESVGATCAGLGFVVGLVLSSILMSTIGSAVNAVIVCFAEGPAEFEANHPELSRKMRETWLESYPECGV